MIALAFLTGLWSATRRARRFISPAQITNEIPTTITNNTSTVRFNSVASFPARKVRSLPLFQSIANA